MGWEVWQVEWGVCEVWGSGEGGVEAQGWCEECNCEQKSVGVGNDGVGLNHWLGS